MGLKYNKHFTDKEKDVYGMFEWEKTDIDITNDSREKLFTQKDAEFPKKWSGLARKIVAAKYFAGEQGTAQREDSAKQLIDRVSETLYNWAVKDNYFSKEDAQKFSDELKYLSTDQRMAFNSPVWFNVGTHILEGEGGDDQKEAYIIINKKVVKMPKGKDKLYPQTSACFIQSVDDTMEDIMALATKEALLFKYGSGTGTNLSTLRSSKEKISGGGKPSGPLAYWAFYDKVAGIVKSGGKTRRAAKMDILNVSHPDILEFINSKKQEEEKLHILIDNGIPWIEASESVNYQNTNISVRVTDEFMQAVEKDKKWKTKPVHSQDIADEMPEYDAKMLLEKIAENTHFCGDPGMQFDTIINYWHTCPNSGRINASNPCVEFMYIDNSSCNLLSQNIMKYMNPDGTFDVKGFSHAIKTGTIGQDLLIDNSSYPTKEIAENSYKFRPLGMGYANIGSMFMSLGLAYDSDEARSLAGAVTALLTGKAYETSTEMAEKIGTFQEYEKNKEPMLKVMNQHKDALKQINRKKIPKGLENILDEAEKTWDNVIERGKKYGFRNAQATVLAPTGTIGFMMDCDTKGVEPEIGLVQTKILSDGGTLRLVNSYVKPTLETLKYEENQIQEIIEYINKNEMMEGAPYIKDEHLAIFDCANKPEEGTRTISAQGHIKMMAAIQPFLSGAISKTVNLPKEATVEEIKQTYMDAWKMELKAVAIYRDQSKRIQPMNFSEKGLEEKVKPVRRKLSDKRDAIVQKFQIGEQKGYVTFGLYEDGSPGEMFISMNKEGSTLGGLMDTIGILTSMSLQYGVPVKAIAKKLRHQNFEPNGIVYNSGDIKMASSISDYLAQYLEQNFIENGKENNSENITNENSENKEENKINLEEIGEPAGACIVCGSQMYKRGHCEEICSNKKSCGFVNNTGCGG